MAARSQLTAFAGTSTGLQLIGRQGVNHDRPIDVVRYPDGLAPKNFRAAAGPVTSYAGQAVAIAIGDGPETIEPATAARIDLLPSKGSAAWRTMATALDVWAPGRNRATFRGPRVAILEPDPSETIRLVLTGPIEKGRLTRVGYPRGWPPEILSFIFARADRVVLDPDFPTWATWIGRPAAGRGYVKICAARMNLIAWRRTALTYNPSAIVTCLPSHRRQEKAR